MGRNDDIHFNTLTAAEIIEQFENMECSTMYQVTLTIEGTHNSYTYTSVVKCSGYTNTSSVTNLALSHNNIRF